MLPIKFNAEKAELLAGRLSHISSDAEASGYLVGLVLEVRRVASEILNSQFVKTGNADITLNQEILQQLDEVRANLSVILTSDIIREIEGI